MGGRVHTWRSRTGRAVVDLGAQWIENAGKKGKINPIYALTQKLGIATVQNKCASSLPARRLCGKGGVLRVL